MISFWYHLLIPHWWVGLGFWGQASFWKSYTFSYKLNRMNFYKLSTFLTTCKSLSFLMRSGWNIHVLKQIFCRCLALQVTENSTDNKANLGFCRDFDPASSVWKVMKEGNFVLSLYTVRGVVWPRLRSSLTQSCWGICGHGLPHVIRTAFRNPREVQCTHCTVTRHTRGVIGTRVLSLVDAQSKQFTISII